MTDWNLWPEEPKEGSNCVGLYNDGSGSFIFRRALIGGYYDTEAEPMDVEFFDESMLYWAYLPEHYKLWEVA